MARGWMEKDGAQGMQLKTCELREGGRNAASRR